MTIRQLDELAISPAVAYIVGMTLPLYKEKELGGIRYIVGSVNHNYNPKDLVLNTPNDSLIYISEVEILNHFTRVRHFIRTEALDVRLLANRNEFGSISAKNGFSILIEMGENSSEQCKKILRNKLSVISNSSEDIKCSFIKGCFDGRSSIDWNRERLTNGEFVARYIAIDVERDDSLQNAISKVAQSVGISLNLNQREKDHSKNDQIRIRPNDFCTFHKKCTFFSSFRTRQILAAITQCR